MSREQILFGWSGGKDSALALREILRSGSYEIAALLTTCTEWVDRVSIHGVRVELLERQADSMRLPLRKIYIPRECTNEIYEQRTLAACAEFTGLGIRKMAFGDLFLADVRAYRDRLLAQVNMTAIYPLWGRDTAGLAREFISDGFRATMVCVDTEQLASPFAGRAFDSSLLADLPPGIDPCGENGEFHTFVYAGPVFRNPVLCRTGEIVERGRFHFADVLALN
jgi:uncharacterized protein (TIGR00290 family)